MNNVRKLTLIPWLLSFSPVSSFGVRGTSSSLIHKQARYRTQCLFPHLFSSIRSTGVRGQGSAWEPINCPRISPFKSYVTSNAAPPEHKLAKEFGDSSHIGNIAIINELDDKDSEQYPIDIVKLKEQIRFILKELGYAHFDVAFTLTNDQHVQELNKEYRGMDKPTDILSFPFYEFDRPGVVAEDSEQMIEVVQDLGEMFVSVPYVQRVIDDDKDYHNSNDKSDNAADNAATTTTTTTEQEDRGVSLCMSQVYAIEDRVALLAVHGLIHLLGHDHEEDGEYEEMVAVEEQVLRNFLRTFPIKGAILPA